MKSIYYILGAGLLFLNCGGESNDTSGITTSDSIPLPEESIDTLPELDFEAQLMTDREENIAQFATLILADDIDAAATFIAFPLKRQAPQPAINNTAEFKTYYPTLFDSTLKTKLQAHLAEPDIIDLSMSNGTIGILNGLIWFNDPCDRVISINYESEKEKEKIAELDKKVRNTMHPILKEYEYNVFLGRTSEGLFRIDQTPDKGLRYASWYGDQNLRDEPDFILWNGVSEKQGTAGGWTTIFDNGVDTQYILDDVRLSENPEDEGLFLLIKDEGEITSKLEVTEVLDPFTEM